MKNLFLLIAFVSFQTGVLAGDKLEMQLVTVKNISEECYGYAVSISMYISDVSTTNSEDDREQCVSIAVELTEFQAHMKRLKKAQDKAAKKLKKNTSENVEQYLKDLSDYFGHVSTYIEECMVFISENTNETTPDDKYMQNRDKAKKKMEKSSRSLKFHYDTVVKLGTELGYSL